MKTALCTTVAAASLWALAGCTAPSPDTNVEELEPTPIDQLFPAKSTLDTWCEGVPDSDFFASHGDWEVKDTAGDDDELSRCRLTTTSSVGSDDLITIVDVEFRPLLGDADIDDICANDMFGYGADAGSDSEVSDVPVCTWESQADENVIDGRWSVFLTDQIVGTVSVAANIESEEESNPVDREWISAVWTESIGQAITSAAG